MLFPSVKIERHEFEKTPGARYFAKQFEVSVKNALNGAGIGSRNFLKSNEPNIAVFTGGGGSLPMLRQILQKPIELEGDSAYFDFIASALYLPKRSVA